MTGGNVPNANPISLNIRGNTNYQMCQRKKRKKK